MVARDARNREVFPNKIPGARYTMAVRRAGKMHELVVTIPWGSRPAEATR